MINLSLALSFLISVLLSPGGRLFQELVDASLTRDLPAYQIHILSGLANYWLPALVIYLILRMDFIEKHLKPNAGVLVLLVLGNLLMVASVVAPVLASALGNVSLLAKLPMLPTVVLSASGLIVIALIWLGYRTYDLYPSPVYSPSFSVGEIAGWLLMLAIPMGIISLLYVGESSPYVLSKKAAKVFQERCQTVGEKIYATATAEVPRGIYLERDSGAEFEGVDANGGYKKTSNIALGDSLLTRVLIDFYEKPNQPLAGEDAQLQFRKFELRAPKGVPVENVSAKYGVFYRSVATEADLALGIEGGEYKIADLAANELLAETVYFSSKRHRQFCGSVTNGRFTVPDLIQRSLNLLPR